MSLTRTPAPSKPTGPLSMAKIRRTRETRGDFTAPSIMALEALQLLLTDIFSNGVDVSGGTYAGLNRYQDG